jgi:hypothetical protein
VTWQGTVIGGLNLFGQADTPLDPDAACSPSHTPTWRPSQSSTPGTCPPVTC